MSPKPPKGLAPAPSRTAPATAIEVQRKESCSRTAKDKDGTKSCITAPSMGSMGATAMASAAINTSHMANLGLKGPQQRTNAEETARMPTSMVIGSTRAPNNTHLLSPDNLGGM